MKSINYLTTSTPLPQYLPYARFLLDANLSHTAKMLYTLLLDRSTLSQKNNWIDERGFVYVVFPLSSLSETLQCSTMSVKRALRSLEDADLIERKRGRITTPNNIFVKVPTEQNCSFVWNDSVRCDGTKMIPSAEQKCSTNQRNKNNLNDNHLIRTKSNHLVFGAYQNVFLTEADYKRLKTEFSELDSLIEQLSAYIQSTGKKYADHAATLRIWAKRQKAERKSVPSIPDYTFMNLLKSLFQKRKRWIEFDTLYSIERLEQLRFFMVENHIPYKVRAALLPVPLNTPMPSCAASRSLWYVSVHPEDVHRVEYYLRTERSF